MREHGVATDSEADERPLRSKGSHIPLATESTMRRFVPQMEVCGMAVGEHVPAARKTDARQWPW